MTKTIYKQCFIFALVVLLAAFAAGNAVSALSASKSNAATLAASAAAVYASNNDPLALSAFAQNGSAAIISADMQQIEIVNAAGSVQIISPDALNADKSDFGFNSRVIERLSAKCGSKNEPASQICGNLSNGLNVCTVTALESGEYLLLSQRLTGVAAKSCLLAAGVLFLLILCTAAFAVKLSKRITKTLVAPLQSIAEHSDGSDFTVPFEELKPFVETLKQRQAAKNNMEQMRQEFTANVSHELKTPLTSISGYAEMIATGIARDEDVQNFARRIHTESLRLLSLIADIIQLSELDYIEGRDDFENVDLLDLAQTVENSLAAGAEKYGITLSVSGGHLQTFGCRSQLEELIYNLCDNAIRYNKQNGKAAVLVFDNGGRPAISVEDTGIGIPEDKLDRVFERFFRVDKGRSKRTGGTGLGLAIVKHIALRHGAEISISSELGMGTKITVTFDAPSVTD